MAKLYEIDEAIMNCVDPETGEILDEEKLNELQLQRDEKIEGVVLWLKNLKSDLLALTAEKEVFAEREKRMKKQIDGLSRWLTFALDGQKFSTTKCTVSFRKSESVEINEDELPKKWFVKKYTVAPDKVAIKNAIKSGKTIKGATIVEKQNPQIN